MSSALQYCRKKNLIKPPDFVISGLILETIMGSMSYNVSKDSSDMDIYGVCVPTRNILFPHTAGYVDILDDGERPKFLQYQQHHVKCEDSGKEFDFTVFGINQFFHLLMRSTPNCIDALFTREECVKAITQAGILLRDNRHIFLSKDCWKTFRGYASSQMKLLGNKELVGQRKESADKYGYDLKFAYQAFRLLTEAEQIITTGDLDLFKGSEELRAIRNGDWTLDRFNKEFEARKVGLEEVYHKCTLPEKPDKKKARDLLLECVELHYGRNLTTADIVKQDIEVEALREINKIMEKVRGIL